MQLTLHVDDRKASFFLELVKSLDFVSVDQVISDDELDDAACLRLYEEARQEPLTFRTLSEVKADFAG